MIGENDTRNDAPFTLDDAGELYDYVASNSRVAELSFWSLGRDFSYNVNNSSYLNTDPMLRNKRLDIYTTLGTTIHYIHKSYLKFLFIIFNIT